MAAETQVPPATAQSANGTAPLPPPEAEDCGCTKSERIMGLLGIGAAIGLLFIGGDLVSGGWLSRTLFPARGDDAAG